MLRDQIFTAFHRGEHWVSLARFCAELLLPPRKRPFRCSLVRLASSLNSLVSEHFLHVFFKKSKRRDLCIPAYHASVLNIFSYPDYENQRSRWTLPCPFEPAVLVNDAHGPGSLISINGDGTDFSPSSLSTATSLILLPGCSALGLGAHFNGTFPLHPGNPKD